MFAMPIAKILIFLHFEMSIKNLTYDELLMKIVQSSFIYRFIHFTQKYHVLKAHLTHK